MADANGSLHGKGKMIINSILSPVFTPLWGDGSLGNVTISSNTSLSPGILYQYENLIIQPGVSLVAHGAIIMVKNTLTVNGLITASGMGAKGATSSRAKGEDGFGCGGAGGGAGSGPTGSGNGGAGGDTPTMKGGAGGVGDGSSKNENGTAGVCRTRLSFR